MSARDSLVEVSIERDRDLLSGTDLARVKYRNRGQRRWSQLAPDPHYACGAAYCDDPACVVHNHDHPNHDD